MSVFLEWRKVRRTGFLPAFVGGGILAALVPVFNMIFREERYLGIFREQRRDPLWILLDANWQMMAMLNLFLVLVGACMLYALEYADQALRKMAVLPSRKSSMLFGKWAVLFIGLLSAVALETFSLGFCAEHWFGPQAADTAGLLKHFGTALLLLLPASILMLGISSACGNMWITLGIGLVGIFVPIAAGSGNSVLMLFPFSMPLRFFCGMSDAVWHRLMWGAGAETVLFAAAATIYQNIRRNFE